MESDKIFVKDRHGIKRFFNMLWKGHIPYLWVLGYILISALLSNIMISATEYSAKMFAGEVGFRTVILPFLMFEGINLIIGSISGVLSGLCSARIDRNFRRMIWGKIVRLPLEYYENNEPKELLSRITTDVSAISQLIMQVFVPIITTVYTVVITLKKIGTYDSDLMISLIVVLPINVLIAFIVGKIQFGIHDVVNKKNAALTSKVAESANNSMLIKSFGTEEKEFQKGKEKMKEHYRSNVTNTWITNLTSPVHMIVGMMQFIVIVMVGRTFYANGSLSLPEWIAYFGFANIIVDILSSYCGNWITFKSTQGSTNRVAKIMEELEEASNQGIEVSTLSGDIKLEHITFSYGENTIFKNLNVTIPEGKVTAIIGPSGSGKTTILNLIDRLYHWREGTIRFGEQDVMSYLLKSYRESLAYITQECMMFSGTIGENIVYGVHKNVEQEEVDTVCKAVGIYDFIEELDDKFETKVGEGGSTLSGGQKQRIAIARALLKRPAYLLMDEATAAMDIDGKDEIWKSIYQEMKGKTVVLVAHDKQTVTKAEYIIVMDHGVMIDAGTKEEIAKRNGYYQELVGERG